MPQQPPAADRPPTPVQVPDADALEFEAFARDQDPLDIAAATWVTRRRDGLDAGAEAELQAWMAADPRHTAAFEDMDATFGELRQLPCDDPASLKSALAPPVPASGPSARTAAAAESAARTSRWAATVALALAFAGVAWTGWAHWQRQPTFEAAYATERGRQLAVALPDAPRGAASAGGTALQLDTATRLDAQLYRDRREIRLHDGQAMFAVHGDPQRPFHVRAGPLRITVVGTRFSVRHTATGLDAGSTVVSVEEGRVRVARAEPGAGAGDAEALELTAGQRVTADPRGQLGPVTVVPPAAIALWRDGRISFEQTPLALALAEFERYGRTGLVVRDPAVAALPVGGSYSLRQFQRFAETLPQVLPVRLLPQGELTEVVAR